MRRLSPVILSLCLTIASMAAAWSTHRLIEAQTSTAGSSSILFQETIAVLPAPPALFRLLRISVEPGAGSPMHTHPGPEIGVVQQGILAVTVRGPAVVRRASTSGTPMPVVEPAPNIEFLLYPGDQISYPTGTPMAYRNTGRAPAEFLAAVLLPTGDDAPPGLTWSDGPPAEDALAGVSSVVLGEGVVESLAPVAQQLTIERLALAPMEPIPGDPQATILAVESGSITFALMVGDAQISSSLNPGRTVEATPTAFYLLLPGDALFFPNGMAEASRASDGAALTLLRMSLAPESALSSGTATAPSEIVVGPPATPVPQPATPAAPLTFEPGTIVVVGEDGLRLRDAPSTSANVLATLAAGQQLQVTGPPVQGGDTTWVPVFDPNTGLQGYVAADFIEVLDQ